MQLYLALLRGINVGGNNKVPMAELKACFEAAGFGNVKTYINSGNIIFSSSETDELKLAKQAEQDIEKTFKLPVRVIVLSHKQMQQVIKQAPKGWGKTTDLRHNAAFVFPPTTGKSALQMMGEPKLELESAAAGPSVVYWSSSMQYPSRTTWSRIVGKPIYKDLTIRNSNTTIKLLNLMDDLSKNTNQ